MREVIELAGVAVLSGTAVYCFVMGVRAARKAIK
jgi:hypothetical protein